MSMDAASGYLVSVDIIQMKQVFLNIFHNSFDAIEEKTEYGGKIHISLQQTTDSVTVSIQDDGVGMNDITKQNVFIPFFTTKSEGTGLGLSVCKRIIENHGGYLHLDSTVGHGTRIAVSLPPRR